MLCSQNRTAGICNGDRRARRRLLTSEPGLWGSDLEVSKAQNPAEAREFLDLDLTVLEELCHRRLGGGGGSSEATGLSGRCPAIQTEPTGLPGGEGSPERIRLCGPFPERQGNYREISSTRALLTSIWSKIPSPSAGLVAQSL